MTEDASFARRHRQRSGRTRERLLDAALTIFLTRGYDGASLTEITDQADLGTGTFYLHFRDKRSLYEAVVRRALLELARRWALGAGERQEPAARVASMIRTAIHFFADQPLQSKLFLLQGPAVETWLVDEIGQAIARILGPGVAAPEAVANLVIGAVLAAGRWSLQRGRGALGTEALVDSTIRFCTAGIAASAGAGKLRTARRR